ncbi:hypothetical protein PILCRDRAFT_13421 [Piloderma croceum F 1598]|uniref:Regulator of chromosome condensation 1/beta-lactamase-inhibitor protein II n=1 Tax=Piloderma croceum (strain F 1598) TaxID=765440 RepID=A0A0C3ESZ7_PILCF|nr:hypothetical protein PILCRDRAFT_13421 [Piloderma croceum F 1598]
MRSWESYWRRTEYRGGLVGVWGAFRTANGELFFSHQSPVKNLPVLVFHPPQKFTSITAGPNHFLAVTTHSDIYSWGIDEDGWLGRKPTHTRSMEGHPAKPSLVLLGPKRGKGKKAVYVGTRSKLLFAVDESGSVWGWGMNGQDWISG